MLLLVLILVLAAFALLVVALIQGSVLWAWLSVAVSVAAASVLLVDWWQRQQAARDDEELPPPAMPDPAVGAAATSVEMPRPSGPVDFDSVTEFIPITPHLQGQTPGSPGAAAAAAPDGETSFLPQEQLGAPGEPSASEQTVLLPVARPPGSADQPPGAVPGTPPWSAQPSQSVTAEGPPEWSATAPATSVPSVPSDPAASSLSQPPSVGEETVLQSVDGEPQSGAQGTSADPAQRDPGTADDAEEPTGLFVPASSAAAAAASLRGSQAPAEPAGADHAADHAPAAAGEQPADRVPPGESSERADLPPAGADGEPPEEPHDAATAAVAASVEDEVVVVDEHPRYHVEGCTFLPGRAVIPLPAREAVELGFSACGWCRPNADLARRHQAAAR